MLDGEPNLTLDLLNTATCAWVEQEYHRRVGAPGGAILNKASAVAIGWLNAHAPHLRAT